MGSGPASLPGVSAALGSILCADVVTLGLWPVSGPWKFLCEGAEQEEGACQGPKATEETWQLSVLAALGDLLGVYFEVCFCALHVCAGRRLL